MLQIHERCLQKKLVLETLGTGRKVQIINLVNSQVSQCSVPAESTFCMSAASTHAGAAVVAVTLSLRTWYLRRITGNKEVYHHISVQV